MSREEEKGLNKFTKSGLIRLVVALKKVCNHQEEEIERLKRKIYNPFKRKYSDKDINKFLGFKPIN
tara:strand:- start:167 stop:364 length:198 start_codon:yes stop_codon:yes gene_type:complete